MSTPLRQLRVCGQSPWVDYIARPFLHDGRLDRLIAAGITGITSNPTIFQSAIASGGAYDEQLQAASQGDPDPGELALALVVDDIRSACDRLLDMFERDRTGRDGWVSLEVDPTLAAESAATVHEAQRLHALVGRPNLYVKIPGTEAGIEAIEETIASGIPVNVTLLFSLDRHRAAAEAYIRGVRRLVDDGGDPRSVASVASFFVSRVDTEVDRRLKAIGGHDELRGRLGIANARLAYQTYLEVFGGSDWGALASAGARPQYCLWASTSTKDDAYRDVMYVEELIGEDTINTMPPETIDAFLDHGRAERTLPVDVDDSLRTMDELAAVGVDYDDVVATLEREGVERFKASFEELRESVESKRRALLAA